MLCHAVSCCVMLCRDVQGKVEKDPEVLMIIKTQAALLDNLTAKVCHAY